MSSQLDICFLMLYFNYINLICFADKAYPPVKEITMNTKWIIGIIALVIIGAGSIALSRQKDGTVSTEQKNNPPVGKEDEPTFCTQEAKLCPDESYVSRSGPKCEFAPCPKSQTGSYANYSPTTLQDEFENNSKVVLFFHAKWCPSCIAANKAFLTKADQIPAGVTVLKTDYDTEKELKTKYGVTYQHTFVQIDAEGNMIAKWNGGDIDELKKNLK